MDIDTLKQKLDYDPTTGAFTWRNGIRAVGGRPAGTLWENGYVRIRAMGRYVYAHRLAFAFSHGYWPSEVDHANGDRQDNRAENLRECTRQQNQWNARKRGDNPTSLFKGVYWNRQKGKWQARLCAGYRSRHLGFFDDESAAAAAYLAAASKAAGEFARAV